MQSLHLSASEDRMKKKEKMLEQRNLFLVAVVTLPFIFVLNGQQSNMQQHCYK